jgi:hypothetical protein
MKAFNDISRLKKRLLLSLNFGLLSVLAYVAIIIINHPMMDSPPEPGSIFWIIFFAVFVGVFLKAFIFCTCLPFFLMTIYVIKKKGFSNLLLMQTIISLTILLLVSISTIHSIVTKNQEIEMKWR